MAGKDGAGVVRAVGPGVEKLRVNDRVYVTTSVTGTYATHAIANAKTVGGPSRRVFESDTVSPRH
jgi:NADPH:quinone reductase-like Zn-dependent oxidoreductase